MTEKKAIPPGLVAVMAIGLVIALGLVLVASSLSQPYYASASTLSIKTDNVIPFISLFKGTKYKMPSLRIRGKPFD